MRRLALMGLFLAYSGAVALGMYEITAKSPQLLGAPLPGWQITCRAENATPWQPATGIHPLDRVLHETQEAAFFYGSLGVPVANQDPDR